MTLVGRRRYKQAERPPVLPLWLHIQLSLTHSKQYLLNTHTPSKKVQWYHCWIVFPLGSMKSKERESGPITQFIFRQNTWLCWIGRKYEYKYKYKLFLRLNTRLFLIESKEDNKKCKYWRNSSGGYIQYILHDKFNIFYITYSIYLINKVIVKDFVLSIVLQMMLNMMLILMPRRNILQSRILPFMSSLTSQTHCRRCKQQDSEQTCKR